MKTFDPTKERAGYVAGLPPGDPYHIPSPEDVLRECECCSTRIALRPSSVELIERLGVPVYCLSCAVAVGLLPPRRATPEEAKADQEEQ